MLIEGGDEDDVRGWGAVEHPASHFEAGQARHLDIEKHEVGLEARDRRQGFHTVARLADHFHAAHVSQEVPQFVARERLVVHQHGPEIHQAMTRSGASSSGISTLAQVPRPGTLVSVRW